MREGRVLVPHADFDAFQKRLGVLNRKAAQFGLSPINVANSETRHYYRHVEVTGKDSDVIERSLRRLKVGEVPPRGELLIPVYEIALDYPVIKLGDWRVVAQVEAFQGANLVFSVAWSDSDAQQLERFHDCPIECEHCKTHRQRKVSYVLQSETELKQVGSSCLEDFTGIDPAAALFMAKMYDFVKVVDCSDDFESGSYDGKASAFATQEFLARVLFLTEKYGFISATRAKDDGVVATYETAWRLESVIQRDPTIGDEYWGKTSRLREAAKEITDWYEAKVPSDSFERNLKLILSATDLMMDRKHLAFAAAAIPSFFRHKKKLLDDAVSLTKPSAHVGVKGDKLVAPVTLDGLFPYETQFGLQYRVNMRDMEGNRLSWKTSNPPAELREAGAVGLSFVAQFKIKDHGEFRDVLCTDVSHLKFKSWVVPENSQCADWSPEEVVVLVIKETGTAAFQDLGTAVEIASILDGAGRAVMHGWGGRALKLSDTNGNVVGSMEVSSLPAVKVDQGVVRARLPFGPELVAGLAAVAENIQAVTPGVAQLIRNDAGDVLGELFIGLEVLGAQPDRVVQAGETLEL